MITASQATIDMLNSPVRDIKARVGVYQGSNLVEICYCEDRLKSLTIERIGEESKFFGFGICQKLKMKLIDLDRSLNITTEHSMKVELGKPGSFIKAFPTFYVSEIDRDEKTNELTIVAYDIMYPDSAHFVSDINITAPYTIQQFVAAAAECYGTSGYDIQRQEVAGLFNLTYPEGGNFNGDETIREALNDVAEATATVFYIDYLDRLVFKKLDKDIAPDLEITKDKYFTFRDSTDRTLAKVVHVTELGDNLSVTDGHQGVTQYLRDNAFLDNYYGATNLMRNAFVSIRDASIFQFNCKWRGNYLLEIGDKIALTTKDGGSIISYVLNDSIVYDGGLSETTQWSYTNNDVETDGTPISLGGFVKQTYAKVDKINQNIELVASDSNKLRDEMSSIRVETDGIIAEVESITHKAEAAIGSMNTTVSDLTKRVQLAMTAEQVEIAIESALENGVGSIETSTGFVFNDQGLTISKKNSVISTQITEDGMVVSKDNQDMLIANNEGVKAQDLHATTFLIIGTNSRFEDYNNGTRTGCFWIGQQGG